MPLNNEEKETAVTILSEMLSLLGLSAEIKLEEREDGTPVIALESEEPGRLIGRRGRVVEGLEFLLNCALSQQFKAPANMVIDVNGGSGKSGSDKKKSRSESGETEEKSTGERKPEGKEGGARQNKENAGREEQLKKLAEDVAKEVKRWGDSKLIGPYNAAERKIIHSVLTEEPEVTAESGEEEQDGRKKIKVQAIDSH